MEGGEREWNLEGNEKEEIFYMGYMINMMM